MSIPTECPREIYLRVTDSTGRSRVDWHLAWDAEKFLAAQVAAWEKEGCRVAVATRAEYLEQIRRPNG